MRLHTLLLICIWCLTISGQFLNITYKNTVIAAITDNGCSKPTQIEIKPRQSNAEAYNYPSLSTNY